jgi:hypothetical protein
MAASKSKKTGKRRSQFKHRTPEVEKKNAPFIPENGEVEFKSDPVEDTIQKQYAENKNMMTERMSHKHNGIDNVPAAEITRVLEILFKFNNLASVAGHSEQEVLNRDIQAKSPKSRRASLA